MPGRFRRLKAVQTPVGSGEEVSSGAQGGSVTGVGSVLPRCRYIEYGAQGGSVTGVGSDARDQVRHRASSNDGARFVTEAGSGAGGDSGTKAVPPPGPVPVP